MPVEATTPKAISIQLKQVAEKFLSGVEITKTEGNIFTYSTEAGYHKYTAKFTAEITVGEKPEDAVIKLKSKGASAEDLLKTAEAFCQEKFDCHFEL